MKVKYIPTNDSVIVNRVDNDGLCSHNSTHWECEQMDWVNPYGQDHSEVANIEVCNHCSAYREEYSLDWQGIQVMPL